MAVVYASTIPTDCRPLPSTRWWAVGATPRTYAPATAPRTYNFGGKMTDLYPKQTVEYVPIPVTGGGAVITVGVAYSIVPDGTPPGTWTAAVIVNSQTCWLLSGLTAGKYRKWAQVTAGTEVAVIDCGTLSIV